MRVFHVYLEKSFDVKILGESIEDVEAALDDCQHEIDREWNPPDWDISVVDTLTKIKRVDQLPKTVPTFDMVLMDGNLFSADETGALKEKVLAAQSLAEQELAELRLKLGMENTQMKLPFDK